MLTEEGKQRRGVRGRALFIGALGAAATAGLVTQAEMVLSTLRIGYLQFPPAALGLLILVLALNQGLKRLAARWSLSSSDVLVIYCMALVAAMVSSHGVVEKWIPLLVAPRYLAESGWHQLYDPHIPSRLVPYNPSDAGRQRVVEEFFNKTPHGEAIPWQPWLVPLLHWSVLILLVLFAFLCLTTILRRQWVDNERLAFPLAQFPMEVLGGSGRSPFFRNRLFWFGAAIPILVYTIKGLHQAIPTFPDITLFLLLNDYLTTPPWSGITYTPIVLSFAAVGFFYLLPADVLFSIWFFYLLTLGEQVTANTFNMSMPIMPLYPLPLFVGYQTVGAYLVLVAYLFWSARPHLRRVWAAAIGRASIDDSQELIPYRVAVWGLFGSILLSSLWLWSAGMSVWLALLELIVFLFGIALVMARSTAEAGMLMTETTFRPIDLYRMVAPVASVGPTNLTMLAFFDHLFLRDQRGLVLTGMLDTARIADSTEVRRRAFVKALALGIGLALVVAVALNIYLPYHLGALTMDSFEEREHPLWTWRDYAPYFNPGMLEKADVSWQMPTFFSVGILVTAFLTFMRANFFWWPLHPLGYALAGSWSTDMFWFSCLLAWVLKALSLRYGGRQFFAKARPFFLGLVLGEFGIEVAFVLLNILFKIPPPAFPLF